jgi:hypothetical protein
MLNQRRCCHCGNGGPFARVATCQDTYGEILGFLCLCAACDAELSPGAFRDRMLDHLAGRITMRRSRRFRLPARSQIVPTSVGD